MYILRCGSETSVRIWNTTAKAVSTFSYLQCSQLSFDHHLFTFTSSIMSCIRPATPGFIVTSIATILLAIVALCVPINKSVFFLRASITEGGFNGSIVFGTLGYCLELSNGTTCSKPSVGYELGQFSPFHPPFLWQVLTFYQISTVLLATSYPSKFLKSWSNGSPTC